MAGRSLRVHPDYIEKAKKSLQRNRFASQRHLAEDMGLCRDTISKFLNGKPVDNENFQEICRKLGLDDQEIADFENDSNNDDSVADIGDSTADETESNVSNYVERPPIEERCYQTVLQPGSLIRIKAPKQMGKTTLITQILSRVQTNGYKIITLNLRSFANRKVLQDLDYFLNLFCRDVSRKLQLPSANLAEYWEDGLGSSYNCNLYFEEYLLENLHCPVVLALDEVDCLFPYPHIAEDFFSLLRCWHEEAKKTEVWKKVRLIISYSTEVYIPLDIHHSPFNVGEPISLPEFTPPQVQEFARQQGVNLESEEIKKLINLIGGHPSLLQIAVSRLKRQEITFDKLLETAATESGIYTDRLRTHLGYLQQNLRLSEAMKEAVSTPQPIRLESKLAYQLESLGLVRLEGNDCRITCDLYRQYFRDRL
ncbi:AAA-like domain-containing protein [Laspinema palackyanum]|uniref:AAA-like domain-containing protein n=1 Tax=Laspinema palackyanum TaxID=3231601 RepID=UPI00345CAFC8|nr:AAA-like domain-containing protein [Laspinema sp. D2c]